MSLMLNPLAVPSQLLLTPSGQDGIPWELEEELRMYGAQLIQQAGSLLELPQVAMATAQVLFQRFWFVTSLKYFSVRSICMGALFLSSKLEETPLGLRNLINVFDFLIQRAEHASSLSPSPRSTELDLPRIDEDLRRAKSRSESGDKPKDFQYQPRSYHTASFHDTKDALVIAEMQLLKRLGFQTETQLPYAIMVNYLQLLGWSEKRMWVGQEVEEEEEEEEEAVAQEGQRGEGTGIGHGPEEATKLVSRIARQAKRTLSGKGRGVAQVAWGFLNDSLQTPLPALFPPHVLATASIYLCTLLDPTLPALPTPRPPAVEISKRSKVERTTPLHGLDGTMGKAELNGRSNEAHDEDDEIVRQAKAAKESATASEEGKKGDEEEEEETKGEGEEQEDQLAWYHLFDVTRSQLRVTSSWILRLYSTSTTPSSTSVNPSFDRPETQTQDEGTPSENGKRHTDDDGRRGSSRGDVSGLASRVREEHGGMVEFLDKERVRRWLEVRDRREAEGRDGRGAEGGKSQ